MEQNEVVTEQAEVAANQSTENNASVQLQQHFWEDAPAHQTQQPAAETNQSTTEEKKEDTRAEAPAVVEWWKEFEFQDADTAKVEIQKLKQVRPYEEIKFANDQSKQVHELLREGKIDDVVEIYNKQRQLDKIISSEVNTQTADDIIKLQMKLRYPTLKDDQIEFQFNEDYGVGKKPTYDGNKETEDEFNERLAAWNDQVARVNMKKTIAATMAIPELKKLKAEIVLPEIAAPTQTPQSNRQPTQEEIAADKKMKEEWAKAASNTATAFKGLSTTAKYKDGDKDVEIPVSYGLSPEETKTLTTKLTAFAESNFDPYTILKDRWVDEKGNDKLDQVIEDLSWLMFGKNAAQKFANEAANQRLEIYLKEKKNIRVDGDGGRTFGQDETSKTASEQLQETFWGTTN